MRISIFHLILLFVMVSPVFSQKEEGHETVKELVKTIETAIHKKDKDLFFSCIYWDNISPELQRRLKHSSPAFLKYELLGIEVSPSIITPWLGLEVHYNVEYRGDIIFSYKEKGMLKVAYGMMDDKFYLATPVRINNSDAGKVARE